MAHKLADETLATILAQSLAVSDDDFACTNARKSPFASDALSSSTMLLVCKRWMRVATPLLYETVVLRSIPQAMALASALKANRDFGRYIKKVRVEGGVGASICSVFKAAPNITDLALTLDLYAADNVAPMYKSLLETVAPRRLVLCSAQYRLNKNKATSLAVETVCKCIEQWTVLRVVVLSDDIIVRCSPIYQAICRATQLDMIHIPHPEPRSYRPDSLSVLAESCSAPIVRVGWRAQGVIGILGIPEDRWEKLSPRAREKVQFARPLEQIPDVLPINPLFTPLAKASPSARCIIWTKILEIVVEHTTGIDVIKLRTHQWTSGDSHARLPRGPVLQCMLVCKEWKDIVTPLACRDVRLRTWPKFQDFEALLNKGGAHLPELVRSLQVGAHYLVEPFDTGKIEKALPSFLERFNRLEAFESSTVSLSPGVLDTLTSTAGPHLRTLTLRSSLPGTYILPSLPRLTKLHWRLLGSEISFPTTNQSQPSFPALEELEVSGFASGPFLQWFAKCSMPKLRALEFSEACREKDIQTFCSANGAQLLRVVNTGHSDMLPVILHNCPKLTSVDFGCCLISPNPDGPAKLEAPHTALEELTIPSLHCLQRVGTTDEDDAELFYVESFLENLTPERFPALRTVRINQCDVWPTTQRKLAKHPMPPLAEMMLARGIRLVDRGGVGWKPRLTTTRKKQPLV